MFLLNNNSNQALDTVSVKNQLVNMLCFAGHVVSVVTTQLCHCNSKQPQITHKQGQGCVPVKLYL